MFVGREELERWLSQGESLAQIGVRVGKHPSTVGYWVRKHGLAAARRDRHAPRGVDGDELRRLVAAGMSQNAAAGALGVSPSTVRYWMGRLGLETGRMTRRRERGTQVDGAPAALLTCERHGQVTFHRRGERYRCGRCASEAVARRRRRVKRILVQEAGGRCCVCGYDRYLGALEFHHLDPRSKAFSLSAAGVTRSLAKARVEAAKCVLLCANCHAEVEGGIVTLASGSEATNVSRPVATDPG